MIRFTEKNANGFYSVPAADHEKAIQRLGAFEDAYDSLLSSQEQIPAELADLRLQGKDKTATYKEMVAQKLINNNIAIFFERHGLK